MSQRRFPLSSLASNIFHFFPEEITYTLLLIFFVLPLYVYLPELICFFACQ